MFRAIKRSSSGESIVSVRPLVYVTLCKRPCGMQAQTCIPQGRLTVTVTSLHLATLEGVSCTENMIIPEAVVTVLCTPDDGCG